MFARLGLLFELVRRSFTAKGCQMGEIVTPATRDFYQAWGGGFNNSCPGDAKNYIRSFNYSGVPKKGTIVGLGEDVSKYSSRLNKQSADVCLIS